jgi:hypothetical protein
METLIQDVKYAVRMLAKTSGFTVVAMAEISRSLIED